MKSGHPREQADQSLSEVNALKSATVASNLLWNISALAIPALLSIASIPMLFSGLGPEQFGILSLLWLINSYFLVFDLGLGQSLTIRVAEHHAAGSLQRVPGLFSTSIVAGLIVGGLGGIGLWIGADAVADALGVTKSFRDESIRALEWLAFSLPFLAAGTPHLGLLQGLHHHRKFSIFRMVSLSYVYLVPLLIVHDKGSIVDVALWMAVGRVALFALTLAFAVRAMSGFGGSFTPTLVQLRHLMRIGGWLTISRLVGPLMVYFDRLLIGTLLGVAALAYYTAPFEVLSKALAFPATVAAALLPVMAAANRSNGVGALQLMRGAGTLLTLVMGPLAAVVLLFAADLMEFWGGQLMASQAAGVAKWLALGVFVNSLAYPWNSQIISAGRADIIAKLHLAELVPYGLLLWWATESWGIQGAAAAWLARVVFDTVAHLLIARKVSPQLTAEVRHQFWWILLWGVFLAALGVYAWPLSLKLLAFAVLLVVVLLSAHKKVRSLITDIRRGAREETQVDASLLA